MLYVSTSTPPSVQLGTALCDYVTPGESVLVINKLRSLSVNSIADGEVRELFEIPVHGLISKVAAVKVEGQSTSTLLVLTTSLQLFALRYTPAFPYATTLSSTSLLDPHARPSPLQALLVDPQSQLLLVVAYQGLVRCVPLSSSVPTSPAKARRASKSSAVQPPASTTAEEPLDLGRGFNIRLNAAEVTSVSFLRRSEGEQPVIVAVRGDAQGRRVASSYAIDLKQRDIVELSSSILDDVGSELAFEVGEGEGVVVLGEESARFVPLPASATATDANKKSTLHSTPKGKARASFSSDRSTSSPAKITARLPVGSVQAWAPVPGREDAYLLGDLYGKLLLLTVERAGSRGAVSGLSVRDLGDANSPTALTFIGDDLVYLASRFGDSQLIRIPDALLANRAEDSMQTDAQEEEDGLELVASYASLAPILDAVVVEGSGASPSQVVTCSGAYKGGSLRVVRQGVGMHELAQLEMEGIQRVWSLVRGGKEALLVLGFFNETRVLSFAQSGVAGEADGGEDEQEIEEIELPQFKSDQQTLLAAVVVDKLVQVTATGVWYEGGYWAPEGKSKITLAEAREGKLVLALDGGVLVLLSFAQGGGGELVELSRTTLENEVAALSISASADGQEPVVAVGLWTTQSVLILSLPALEVHSTQVIPSSFLIRSVLLTNFGQPTAPPLLLCGLGDGTLFSYALQSTDHTFVPSSEKRVTLGKRPVVLAEFTAKGSTSIFAASERPTILSRPAGPGGRIVYSPANLADVGAVAQFDSTAFPGALALATPQGIKIGTVESVQKVDIRPVPLDEDEPRRIAHDARSGAFGVVCLRRDVDRATGEVASRGSVKLLSTEFEELASVELQLNEEGQSIATRPSPQGEGAEEDEEEGASSFVVGTAVVLETEQEPSKGRLLLIDASTGQVQAETTLTGAAYAIAVLSGGEIAVAVNSQVLIYEARPGTEPGEAKKLEKVAEWGGAFIAIGLGLADQTRNELLVTDAMRSVTLLTYLPKREGSIQPAKLEEVARDFRAHYMTAASSLPSFSTSAVAVGDAENGGGGGGEEYIGAESELNLFTLQREVSPTLITKQGKRAVKLEHRAAFHLGEMVSRFLPGSLVRQLGGGGGGTAGGGADAQQAAALLFPSLVYTTSAGSIGTVSQLDPARAAQVSALERNLTRVLPAVGGLGQAEWRAWKDEDAPRRVRGQEAGGARGVVDGDFVESVLEWDAASGADGREGWKGVLEGEREAERLEAMRRREDVVELVEELARSH